MQLYSGVSNSATVSDTLNGSYTALGSPVDDASNGFWEQWFYTKVTSAGKPTVSVSLGTNENGRLIYHRITGFTGTPTIDSAMTGNFSQSSTTSVAISPPNTARNNEAVLLGWKTGSALTSTPSGWTSGGGYSYYLVAASSGASSAFNGTLSASSYYDTTVIGIYDGASPASQFFLGMW